MQTEIRVSGRRKLWKSFSYLAFGYLTLHTVLGNAKLWLVPNKLKLRSRESSIHHLEIFAEKCSKLSNTTSMLPFVTPSTKWSDNKFSHSTDLWHSRFPPTESNYQFVTKLASYTILDLVHCNDVIINKCDEIPAGKNVSPVKTITSIIITSKYY